MKRVSLMACGLVISGMTGCGLNDVGYIEIKGDLGGSIYLDGVSVERPKSGMAILRAKTGKRELTTLAPTSSSTLLCFVQVRKDRLTSVTLASTSAFRYCTCANKGPAIEGKRQCIS